MILEARITNEADLGIPSGIPEGIPSGIPEGIPSGIAEGIPEGIPEGTPSGIPFGIPSGIPEGIPNGVHIRVPELWIGDLSMKFRSGSNGRGPRVQNPLKSGGSEDVQSECITSKGSHDVHRYMHLSSPPTD